MYKISNSSYINKNIAKKEKRLKKKENRNKTLFKKKRFTLCSRKILYPLEPGSGTYLFFLPRSPNSRLATSSLVNFVSARTTHLLILIELYLSSTASLSFPLLFTCAWVSTTLVSFIFPFLSRRRKIVASSKMLVEQFLLPSSHPRERNSNA